jgi:hypothetical protein
VPLVHVFYLLPLLQENQVVGCCCKKQMVALTSLVWNIDDAGFLSFLWNCYWLVGWKRYNHKMMTSLDYAQDFVDEQCRAALYNQTELQKVDYLYDTGNKDLCKASCPCKASK